MPRRLAAGRRRLDQTHQARAALGILEEGEAVEDLRAVDELDRQSAADQAGGAPDHPARAVRALRQLGEVQRRAEREGCLGLLDHRGDEGEVLLHEVHRGERQRSLGARDEPERERFHGVEDALPFVGDDLREADRGGAGAVELALALAGASRGRGDRRLPVDGPDELEHQRVWLEACSGGGAAHEELAQRGDPGVAVGEPAFVDLGPRGPAEHARGPGQLAAIPEAARRRTSRRAAASHGAVTGWEARRSSVGLHQRGGRELRLPARHRLHERRPWRARSSRGAGHR